MTALKTITVTQKMVMLKKMTGALQMKTVTKIVTVP
jgi:hypothetical protein